MLEYTLEGTDRDCELSPLLWLTDPDDLSNPERTAQSDNKTPWTNVDEGSDITQCMVQIN